jgi:uncharacterized protein DUF4157
MHVGRDGTSGLDARALGPLDELLQGELSDVRIHTGTQADALTRRYGARALTTGSDIFFRRGEFDPSSPSGREVIAHEAVHVAQNRRHGPGSPAVSASTDSAELEASRLARSAAGSPGTPLEPPSARPAAAVQRQEEKGSGGGEGPPRVVQRGIKVMSDDEVMETLHLPPETVPPGAASNPDFLLSMMQPGASASRLEPLTGVPEDVVEEVPEGEVVEMPNVKLGLAVLEGGEHGAHRILHAGGGHGAEHAVEPAGEAAGHGAEQAVEHAGEAGHEAEQAVEHAATGSSKVFRVGTKVFKVVNYVYSGYRIVAAPSSEEAGEAGREEAGRLGGGWVGSWFGVEFCAAIGVATEGIGFLICGVTGAMVGEEAGEQATQSPLGYVFGKVGSAIWNIVHAPELMVAGALELTHMFVAFMEVLDKIGEIPAELLGNAIVFARSQLDPTNWDLRYLPAALQTDVMTAGTAVWAKLASLKPDDFMTRVSDPLSAFGVAADVAARLATGLAAPQAGTATPTATELLAMRPADFVRLVQTAHLTFVQNPQYLAGFSGQWDDPAQLEIHLGPLISARSASNPDNWDVSKVPAVSIPSGKSVDLGDAIEEAGAIAWGRLGGLDQQHLPAEIGKQLQELGVTQGLAGDIAAAIEGLPHPGWAGTFGLESDNILQLSIPGLVDTLRSWAVPIDFKTQPWVITKQALQWVRAGFQPW